MEDDARQPSFDAGMIRGSVEFKRDPTRGSTVFFTTNNDTDFQGCIDRAVLFMQESVN